MTVDLRATESIFDLAHPQRPEEKSTSRISFVLAEGMPPKVIILVDTTRHVLMLAHFAVPPSVAIEATRSSLADEGSFAAVTESTAAIHIHNHAKQRALQGKVNIVWPATK